ncbi:MAG: hypothetical protein ABJ327_16025 [Litoreibacter sp.]
MKYASDAIAHVRSLTSTSDNRNADRRRIFHAGGNGAVRANAYKLQKIHIEITEAADDV